MTSMTRFRYGLTVGELRKLIENKPENALVLVPADDHSYRHAHASFEPVRFEDGGSHFSEEYVEIPLGPDDFVDNCLIIS